MHSRNRHAAPFNVTPGEQLKLDDWTNNPEEVRAADGDDVFFHEHLLKLQRFLNELFPQRIKSD